MQFESIFDILNVPLGAIVRGSYMLTHNYALALLLFALAMKVILFPFGIKQQKNMVKQASLKPKETAIRNKYAGRTDAVTQRKMQEEVMALYQKENFNPAGGCLPLLIQMPILFSLYEVVTHPLKYLCGMPKEMIENITTRAGEISETLAASARGTQIEIIEVMRSNFERFADIDGLIDILPSAAELPNFCLWGNSLDLSQIPSFAEPSWLLIIPILTFVFMFGSMKINRKLSYQSDMTADQGMSMKIMDFTMPLFSVWISFSVPAVIGLYWIYQNLFSVVQQYILKLMYPLPVFTEEDYKQAEREYGGKAAKKKASTATSGEKKKVRSLHHIDDEEYMAAYEAQQRAEEEEKSKEREENRRRDGIMAPAKLKEDKRPEKKDKDSSDTDSKE